MGKELVISSTGHETKLAILEDDQLVEVFFQRSTEYSLAGSIHKGRVTRVLPGMQSAFVDIGLERDAFLYVSDFFEDNEEYDRIASAVEEKVLKGERNSEARQVSVPAAAAVEPPPAAVHERAAEPERSERPERADRGDRNDRTDEGDRRGRRSRRRRSRGRGFPESKYATVRAEEPAVEAGSDEPAEEFPVLPGESLAKYRGAAETEQEWQTDEPAAEPGGDDPVAADETAEAAEDLETPDPAIAMLPPTEEEAVEEDAAAEAEEEPLSTPEPLLTEPVTDSDVPGTEPDEAQREIPETEPAEVSAEAEADMEAETVTDLPDGAIPDEPDANGSEIETAEADAEIEAASPADGEAEAVEPARMPVSLTATLREQGHRYMPHRMSRRMRRKMRNQQGPEGAPEQRVETVEARVEQQAPVSRAAQRQEREADRQEKPAQVSITELLKERQEILVQIAKEPLGQKGARITSHIALPGRYVVYMPTVEHLGVSRKISTDEERQRLKRILQTHRTGVPGGFIVRTAGEGKTEDEIASDMRFLFNLWLDIRKKAESRPAPALIHHDLDLVSRILRDQMTDTFKTIWTDSEEIYERVLAFVERFQPTLVGRVKLYTREAPIFDAFKITSELEKALRPKVWLKSGGYIVINQTEALVAIDVNTGKFVGKSNRLEDTIVKTNTEAVKEIVRQVRLRDLGGIIVVDFIDMDERKNRQKVFQALEETMQADRAPNKILQFNDFGLVAITRKRVKQSLERTLCSPCPYCEGAGYVKSVQTVISEILQEAQRIAKAVENEDVTLRVNPEVAKVLKSQSNTYLEELEQILKRPVIINSDPLLQQERFDLI